MPLPPSRWLSSLMALAMTLAPQPATRAIDTKAEMPAAPAADLTPLELIHAAERAYATADWPAAEKHFATLVETYHSTPELAETVMRARPLWVTSRLRLKKLDAQTLALLNEVLSDAKLDPMAADELSFWRALCHVHAGAFAEARQALGEYAAGSHLAPPRVPSVSLPPRAARRAEAVLLHATCLLQENKPAEAAAFLAPHIPALRQQKLPEAAGRAVVLRLHALVTVGECQAALAMVRENQPRLAEITQLAAFHTLTLQLGSRLLEDGRHHDAIACLQRVWPRAQIIAHQKTAQDRFSKRLAAIRQSPGQEASAFSLECLINRLDHELESLGKIEHFDSALRFRIAAAYRELGRSREAALVLEDILARMPSDPVVEKAALCLIQCWMQIEHWPRAVAAAEAYLKNYKRPGNPDIPLVRYLKASSLHADHQPLGAELAFATVHQLHADHELAPRALFLEGICLLEQDLNREALDAFTEVAQRFPASDTIDDAAYWSAMALSFDKRHAEARDRLQAYLKSFGGAALHAGEAQFRIAFSTFGLADYPAAVSQLSQFIAAQAGDPLVEEAKLLLGDALGALGRIDDAVAAYRSVDRTANPRFYEEAVFRIGTAFKISEQPDAQRVHFERFLAEHPESRRLAEAVYWIGQSYQKAGKLESAQDAYWHVLAAHGNNPAASGIEEILEALPKLYSSTDGRDQLITRLAALAHKSAATQPTLTLRLRWAQARLRAKSMPEQARSDTTGLAALLQPRRHPPRITADCADALRESGRPAEAKALYLELRKWHPRALEKDRAFLGLGLLALDSGQRSEALGFFERFERESTGSPLMAEVARIKAGIFEDLQRFQEAQTEYEKLLELPTAPRQAKARALIKLGDLMARQNQDLKSTAYYERVYVSYGKYRPEVASAYAKRAGALERLGERAAATDVWRELAERDDLAGFSQAVKARQRLAELDPSWTPPPLTDDPIGPPATPPRAAEPPLKEEPDRPTPSSP